MVVCAADRAATVYREGRVVGRAPVRFRNEPIAVETRALMLTGRIGDRREWLSIWPTLYDAGAAGLREQIDIDDRFASNVIELLAPGDVVVVTGLQATPPRAVSDILSADE